MDQWSKLSCAFAGAQRDDNPEWLPSTEELTRFSDGKTILRLALLADLYRYLTEDLMMNKEESEKKLSSVQNEFFEQVNKQRRLLNKNVSKGDHKENKVKWSRFSFSVKDKTYQTKMVKAFHLSKKAGYPMAMLESEWELVYYYKLATAYSTDCPLELAAACMPTLKAALDLIHRDRFAKLTRLSRRLQKHLYAVLNCHINWVQHNHKQVLVVPAEQEPWVTLGQGDLRCSRCLKNQTFRSSEIKGNPRNIDVEFDFERMTFGSSCCLAPVIKVPLSVMKTNTCTYTAMKQMYTTCFKCGETIFSEVLVDMDMLQSRCAACVTSIRRLQEGHPIQPVE